MSIQLNLCKCSITDMDTDCVVNAANTGLLHGAGVCGAIFEAAGAEKLRRACSAMNGCPTGSAVITPGFDLKARWIVHAVGPRWQDGSHGEPELLAKCYRSALTMAALKDCRSVAFPLISAGIYGYPKDQAWEVALSSILGWGTENPDRNLDVTVCVLTDEDLSQGRSVLKRLTALPHEDLAGLTANVPVEGFYILQSVSLRKTPAGKPFLNAVLADKSGTMPIVFWHYDGPLTPSDDGKIAFVRGRTSEFKGSLQVTVEELRLAREDEDVDVSTLIPVAPIDTEKMHGDILSLVDSLEDADYRAVCREFLNRWDREFRSIPAAKSVHHSFLHGLLMHTGNMVKAADALAALYPEVINRSLLITGTLLHDFAKRKEFTFSALGLVTDYSVKGQLLGHLVMGAQDVLDVCRDLEIPEEKSVLLQHMLLSHHGKPEYGAAVVPMCAESELLSLIDQMDSRMEIFRENLEQTPLGQFSQRIFPLDGNRIYHHYDPKR